MLNSAISNHQLVHLSKGLFSCSNKLIIKYSRSTIMPFAIILVGFFTPNSLYIKSFRILISIFSFSFVDGLGGLPLAILPALSITKTVG